MQARCRAEATSSRLQADRVERFTVSELKARCRNLGLLVSRCGAHCTVSLRSDAVVVQVSGKKDQLVARIKSALTATADKTAESISRDDKTHSSLAKLSKDQLLEVGGA